jgi:hypothetical protein
VRILPGGYRRPMELLFVLTIVVLISTALVIVLKRVH